MNGTGGIGRPETIMVEVTLSVKLPAFSLLSLSPACLLFLVPFLGDTHFDGVPSYSDILSRRCGTYVNS